LLFGFFFKVIRKEYLGTFFSTVTGKEFVVQQFFDAEDDFVKADVVCEMNKKYWVGVLDKEGKIWVKNGWEKWMEVRVKEERRAFASRKCKSLLIIVAYPSPFPSTRRSLDPSGSLTTPRKGSPGSTFRTKTTGRTLRRRDHLRDRGGGSL